MSYLGTPIDTTNQFQSLSSKQFNGDGSTTDFTLDIAPGSVNDIEVFVGNVRQDPHSAYTLSGTTLSFTGAPPSGTNNIYVVHQAKAVSTITPATNTVTNDMLVGSIANSKLANSSITLNGSEVSLGGSATVGGDNTPSFSAYLSSNQTISNETYTKVQFNSENYDTDNAYDNSSNYRFTIPSGEGGNYFISSNLRFQSFSGGEIRLVVRVNGVDKGYFSTDVASNIFTVTSANFIKNFSASDYIEIFAWQNSGGNLYVQGASAEYLLSTFSAIRVIT